MVNLASLICEGYGFARSVNTQEAGTSALGHNGQERWVLMHVKLVVWPLRIIVLAQKFKINCVTCSLCAYDIITADTHQHTGYKKNDLI